MVCQRAIEIAVAPHSKIIFAGHPDEVAVRTDVTSAALFAVVDHIGMGKSLTIRPGKSRPQYPEAFTIKVEAV